MEQQQPHFLLVTYPAQGHINPALQFANRLIHLGGGGRRVHVTFAITISAHRRMIKSPPPDGLSFATFSDGYDDGFKLEDKVQEHLDQLKRNGTKALTDLVVLPWFWTFTTTTTMVLLMLLGIATMTHRIRYSYRVCHYSLAVNYPLSCLLQTLTIIFSQYFKPTLRPLKIGPLIPSAYLDERDPSNGSKDYMEWLNSKPESSVIYVSFEYISCLMKQQMEEIARGLLDCGRPFLWVINPKNNTHTHTHTHIYIYIIFIYCLYMECLYLTYNIFLHNKNIYIK
ncbi:udp-glycosyltransferase 75c1 [Quercus suber]|uniref:Udp-glycosyltransferase 75c1 n=1 Tax=Quercus suber TaxID=58331 RepID=A0AAW0LD02_QUESU